MGMAIIGAHSIVYTSEPDAVRAIFRDVFGWSHIDAGGGWLIFALPPAEVGVHPADAPSHELSLVCDDLSATIEELRAKGVEVVGEPSEEGWGVTVKLALPGDLELLLYEPRHPTAFTPSS
jgi:predicted enzyme related to lactoylglutathione lyase